jgi:hypothetical protein
LETNFHTRARRRFLNYLPIFITETDLLTLTVKSRKPRGTGEEKRRRGEEEKRRRGGGEKIESRPILSCSADKVAWHHGFPLRGSENRPSLR